jgi:hypothetical protein
MIMGIVYILIEWLFGGTLFEEGVIVAEVVLLSEELKEHHINFLCLFF